MRELLLINKKQVKKHVKELLGKKISSDAMIILNERVKDILRSAYRCSSQKKTIRPIDFIAKVIISK